jgi:hypothetical protein
MSHASPFAVQVVMIISSFPQLEWRKRLTAAPKRLLGAAGAAMWKAWICPRQQCVFHPHRHFVFKEQNGLVCFFMEQNGLVCFFMEQNGLVCF